MAAVATNKTFCDPHCCLSLDQLTLAVAPSKKSCASGKTGGATESNTSCFQPSCPVQRTTPALQPHHQLLPTAVPFPKAIQYALAVSFILASFLAAMFAATVFASCIWRACNAVFAKLAHISNPTLEEIDRSRREARIVAVSDAVTVVVTRRYVHGMRYWQDMAMTVVQLETHTIFYNPMPMQIEEMQALARGKTVVLVIPNTYHHMFVDDYVNAFPCAMLVGSESAAERHVPHLAIVQPSAIVLPAEVEILRVDGWALDEYVMVVHSARLCSAAHFISCGVELSVGGATLLPPWLKRAVCKATRWQAAGGLPLYERLTVSDRSAVASFVSALCALELQTIVSAHGGICEDDAQEVLRRAWAWVLGRERTSHQPRTKDADSSNGFTMCCKTSMAHHRDFPQVQTGSIVGASCS